MFLLVGKAGESSVTLIRRGSDLEIIVENENDEASSTVVDFDVFQAHFCNLANLGPEEN